MFRAYLVLSLFLVPVITEDSSHNSLNAINNSNSLIGLSSLANFISGVKGVYDIVAGNSNKDLQISEDVYLNITQLLAKYGYSLEEHQVTTADGYILKIHRIPRRRNDTSNDKVVFLMHGLMDSSDSWVLQGPHKALAYILADQGYDVWMGNARGNKHSSEHVNLTNTDTKFWKFTWEEIGLYDLPAMLDYALNVTKKEKLYYIGYSQGTTSFYVMTSMKPEYNDKIEMMFSLSPVAYMSHVKSVIVRMFSPANNVLGYFMSNFNTYSPSVEYLNRLLTLFCYVVPRCDNLMNMVVGNTSHIDKTLLPVVFAHMPSGASTLQLVHYGQLVQSGEFRRYDFDKKMNLKVYGQETPPNYNLSAITVPIVLFYSDEDWISDSKDVKLLECQLPNVIKTHLIENYNHLDFMYAATAEKDIYIKIIEYIKTVK